MKRLKFLQEERSRISGEMNAIMSKCETESRSRTAEEKTKWDELRSKLTEMETEIKDLEAQVEIDARSAKPVASEEQRAASGAPAAIEKPKDMSVRGQLKAWMEANKEVIESVRKGDMPREIPGFVIDLRAAANPMTVATTNSGASILLPNIGAGLGQVNDLNRTKPTFWNRLKKGRTGLNPYPWVNKSNKQGNAAFIGEGVLKPLASFELIVETSSAKKVAERFRVSTELLHDIDGMQSLIEDEARFEVEVAANTASLTGTSSSTSPAGVTTLASAFTLTTVETTDPNNMDAIRAAQAQLISLNFDRDIVAFINPIDAANMDLSKGDDGHYLLPPFSTADGKVIKGVPVIEDNNIAVGFLLIGDMSKYKILMYQDFFVRWGLDSDDFSKNLITMIAEMRFHQVFSTNDTGAFIYDSFADIKTAIAAA